MSKEIIQVDKSLFSLDNIEKTQEDFKELLITKITEETDSYIISVISNLKENSNIIKEFNNYLIGLEHQNTIENGI